MQDKDFPHFRLFCKHCDQSRQISIYTDFNRKNYMVVTDTDSSKLQQF